MRAPIKSLAALILGSMLLTSAAAEDTVTISYQEPLQQLQLGSARSADNQKPAATTVSSMRFDAFGRRFEIDLEKNRSLLGSEPRARFGDRFEVYRGEIVGVADSWARIVIADGQPQGMLWDGVELWAIEVSSDASSGVGQPYMYRLGDLQIPDGMLACSDVGPAKTSGDLAKAVMSDITVSAAQGPGATQQIDIAVIADFEFTSNKGANTDAELITRMNNVDGIFSMQLGVQLNVSRIDSFSSNDDPFTDQLDSGTLLDELTAYRDATPAQRASGLSHLFTGRNLDTTTVGIAYTGALCSRRFGAGLTQGTHTVTTDSLIAAHELGHNFGAPHDGTSGSACESETGDFLMAPRVNGVDEFSSCSITQMQDDVNRASCVTLLPGTDVALLGGGQSGALLLGDTATVTFDANSVGTDTADSVNVDVTIPAGVALESVSATAGSCTTGAGTASCALGAIAAGSGATVTISATPSSSGTTSFVANMTAANDANSNNNQASVQVRVDPAVDLVSTAAATVQIALNGSTTIRPTVENRSSIAATNVSLSITPDAGIAIDSASWPAGSCSITDNVASCQAGSVAAQSTVQLQIGVTGTTEGSRSYTMSVDAAEADRNVTNNDASGQLTVGTVTPVPPAANDDSGGGSIGWLSLLFLVLTVRLTKYRRTGSPVTRHEAGR